MTTLTTTKKFELFQSKPLQDCELKDVPSVGQVTMDKLKEANIDSAEKLIGQFCKLLYLFCICALSYCSCCWGIILDDVFLSS
jgi:hypothetical protein